MQPQYPYAPQYPTAQPAYAPQYPAPPMQPQYPAQYAQPVQYAPPAPLPTGTLDDFYDQPSGGGGPSFKFMDANRQPMIGKTYIGIVARPITNADVRAQTDQQGQPQRYKDGRPKFVLVVPMQVAPSQEEFPEGVAGWWVKGQARDELARAMAEAGAPAGPPEAGAMIQVTLVGTRKVPGMNDAYQYRVTYQRPAQQPEPIRPGAGAYEAPAPAGHFTQAVPTAPQPQYVMGMDGQLIPGLAARQDMTTPPIASYVPGPQPQPVQPTPAPVQAAQPVQQPAAAPAMPAGLSPEQAALWAKLTGQPAPAA